MSPLRSLSWSAAVALCSLSALARAPAPDVAKLPMMLPVNDDDVILIVSPHPDDESLCCGGLVSMARRAGADVAIVWVTSGGGFTFDARVVEKKLRLTPEDMQALARQRMGEAQAAGAALGVPPENLFFLGYPDGGVLKLLHENYDTPFTSKTTGENKVPWEQAVRPGAPYTGADMERDFAAVLDKVRPTLVLAPSPNDHHPDHRGAGILAMRGMQARNELDRVYYWIVHGGRQWPTPRSFEPGRLQTPPPRGAGMPWEQYIVDHEARETKQKALREHKSQIKVMGGVMMSYVRATELFSKDPVAGGKFEGTCADNAPCVADELTPEEAAL